MKSLLGRLLPDQAGGVSVYSSMIIMVVLMLAALSFATIMSRNYQQTSENQLNTQAFYAAETGVADARARLLRLLDAYGRGVRESLPASLADVSDNDLNSILSGVPGTKLGRAVAIETDDKLFISSEDPGGQVYYLEVGVTLVCEDDQTPANSYDTFSGNPITTQNECLSAIQAADPSWTVGQFRAPATGSHSQITRPSGSLNTTKFGEALDFRNGCLLIGDSGYDSNRGAVHAYQYVGTSWTHQGSMSGFSLGDRFGISFATAVDGSLIAIGAPGRNEVHLYSLTSACSPTFVNRIPGSGGSFGSTVAFSGTDRIAVAAPDTGSASGSVFVYDISTPAVPSSLGSAIVSSDWGSQIGQSLAIHNDRLAVGSPIFSQVKVYEYDERNLSWTLKNTLNGFNDGFGTALGMDGGFLAVGAPLQQGGKVAIYQYKDDSWDNKIDERWGVANNDLFGNSLAMLGRHVAVGAPGATTKANSFRLLRIKSLGDLTLAELSELLEQECVNKGDPDTDDYKFDLLDAGEGIHYSCLSINLAPEVLYYDEIERDRSLNILLKSIDDADVEPAHLDRLIIRWVNIEDQAGSFDTTSDYPNFPKAADWGYSAPVLELQITPLYNDEGYNRQILNALTKTVYVYPTTESPDADGNSGNTSIAWGDLESGDILKGHCGRHRDETASRGLVNNVNNCTIELKDMLRELNDGTLTAPNNYPAFHPTYSGAEDQHIALHVRVRSLYEPAHLEIRGYSYDYSPASHATTTTGNWQTNLRALNQRQVRFREIQAVVGATGHAGNVQVRLEERFRLQPLYDYPEHGVQSSQTVCKILISDQDTGTDVTGGSLAPSNLPAGVNLSQECAAW